LSLYPLSFVYCIVCPLSFVYCIVCPCILYLLSIVLFVLYLLSIVLFVPVSCIFCLLCCLSFIFCLLYCLSSSTSILSGVRTHNYHTITANLWCHGVLWRVCVCVCVWYQFCSSGRKVWLIIYSFDQVHLCNIVWGLSL
jgi:hypothetical protein